MACAAVGVLAMLAGCGSGSGSGSDPDSTAGGGKDADTAAARAMVKKYSEPMTSVFLPSLAKKPAAGKKIVVVVNNLPESQYIKEGALAAAKVLGWTAVPVVYDVASPTGVTDAFAQAVTEKPDGVITQALNATDYAQAAKTFAKADIPVVTSNTTDEIVPPIIANTTSAEQIELSGRLAAAYAVAEKGGKASVAMFNIPSFPVLKVYEKAFKDEYQSLCPGCHYESHALQAADIGTKVPAQVVSAVQRTPSINFAAMGFGGVSKSVSGALHSAGLNGVRIIGIAPAADNLTAVSKGAEDMWVALPITTIGWKSVDALARHFNKEPVDVATTAQTPFQIITRANAEENLPQPEVRGYRSIFKKLWKVG